MKLEEVAQFRLARLSDAEAYQLVAARGGKANWEDIIAYGLPLFNKLNEIFLTSGDMPYGVARARTGDPDEWIIDHLKRMDEFQFSSFLKDYSNIPAMTRFRSPQARAKNIGA